MSRGRCRGREGVLCESVIGTSPAKPNLDMGVPFINSRAKRRDQVVAVDFGVRTTKAVHVQRRGDTFHLVNYAFVDSPIFEKNSPPDVLSDHLKNVIRVLGCKAKLVTLALGDGETVFRQVEVPLMPVSDLRRTLKFNAKAYLQQDFPDHVFDCHYVAGSSFPAKAAEAGKPAVLAAGVQKQKALVGGVRQQTLDRVQAAFKAAGMVVDHVVPGAVGPVNAFEMAEPESYGSEVVALVELGFKSTAITILDCGEIALSRVVAIGGDRLTSGLAEALGISYQEAENIKVGMASEVAQELEPLIQPLGRELRASIDFFENHHDKAVGKVFLSGGSACSELVVQSLQTELMVPCQVWVPTKGLQMAFPPERMGDLERLAPKLTVAVGAAAASF